MQGNNLSHQQYQEEHLWEPPTADYTPRADTTSLKGLTPESWYCLDCGMNTAPGMPSRADADGIIKELGSVWKFNLGGGVPHVYGPHSEVYIVRESVWKKTGLEGYGGCLCIGCLERRIGRRLKPKDFPDHPLNWTPGTPRLLNRRGG